MRIDRESFIRFAVAVALACYDLPADRAMTSEEAAQLVKWVIDMALGPDASNVQVEPMENYPASSTSILYGLVRSGISTSASIVAVVLSATWTAL